MMITNKQVVATFVGSILQWFSVASSSKASGVLALHKNLSHFIQILPEIVGKLCCLVFAILPLNSAALNSTSPEELIAQKVVSENHTWPANCSVILSGPRAINIIAVIVVFTKKSRCLEDHTYFTLPLLHLRRK